VKLEKIPEEIRRHIIPKPEGRLIYRCLGCGAEYDINRLLYTCPACGQVLLIEDLAFDRLLKISADKVASNF
jgi:threonine synthase